MKFAYANNAHPCATIIRFRDGDTIECYIRCGDCGGIHAEVIRLCDIESWEISGPSAAKALATAATLTDRFRGAAGLLVRSNGRRDKYSRLIGDISIEGTLLTKILIDEGWAWVGVGNHSQDIRSLPVPTTN